MKSHPKFLPAVTVKPERGPWNEAEEAAMQQGAKVFQGFVRAGIDPEDLRARKLELACKLTLLFHSGSPWTEEKKWEWNNYVAMIYRDSPGSDPTNPAHYEATTKALCDAIRTALA